MKFMFLSIEIMKPIKMLEMFVRGARIEKGIIKTIISLGAIS